MRCQLRQFGGVDRDSGGYSNHGWHERERLQRHYHAGYPGPGARLERVHRKTAARGRAELAKLVNDFRHRQLGVAVNALRTLAPKPTSTTQQPNTQAGPRVKWEPEFAGQVHTFARDHAAARRRNRHRLRQRSPVQTRSASPARRARRRCRGRACAHRRLRRRRREQAGRGRTGRCPAGLRDEQAGNRRDEGGEPGGSRLSAVRGSGRLRGRSARSDRPPRHTHHQERKRRCRLGPRGLQAVHRPRQTRAGHGEPQLVAQRTALHAVRPLQGGRPDLPGSRLRPLQYHLRAGRYRLYRVRPADLDRDRQGRLRPGLAAPGPKARTRGRSQSLSHRPLRRGAGDRLSGRRGRGQGEDHRGGRIRRALGQRERDRRQRDGTPRDLHVRRDAPTQPVRRRERRPGPDHVDRHGDAHDPDRHRHRDRPEDHGGRRRNGLPDDAGHRSAGGDEHLLPAVQGHVDGGELHQHVAQLAHAARRAGPRPSQVGQPPSRR